MPIKKKCQAAGPQIPAGQAFLERIDLHPGLKSDYQYDHDHDNSQDPVEQFTRNIHGQVRTDQRTGHRGETQVAVEREGAHPFTAKSGRSHGGLQDNGHTVGTVGHRRGQPQPDKHGEGDQGGPAGYRIDKTNGESHNDQ